MKSQDKPLPIQHEPHEQSGTKHDAIREAGGTFVQTQNGLGVLFTWIRIRIVKQEVMVDIQVLILCTEQLCISSIAQDSDLSAVWSSTSKVETRARAGSSRTGPGAS